LVGGEIDGEDLSQHPVAARAAAIHPPGCPEHQRRPARPFAIRRDLLYPARTHQSVEMEADGVGVYLEHFGDSNDAHRSIRGPQYAQYVATATEGLLRWFDDVAHSPAASSDP
jgi:hypothetical protein